jgi:Uncharacterized conserved protein
MSDLHGKHEHKWAFDETVRFKAMARRNKLLGLWAASALGLTGDEAEAYAKTVVASDMKEPGEEDVFRKVAADFAAKGVALDDEALRQKMYALTKQVHDEIEKGA